MICLPHHDVSETFVPSKGQTGTGAQHQGLPAHSHLVLALSAS